MSCADYFYEVHAFAFTKWHGLDMIPYAYFFLVLGIG